MKTKVFNLIIVDESGSMYTIEREAFSGMNETLQTIKAVAQENQELEQRVTLITFDSNHTRFHYDNAEGNAVVPLRFTMLSAWAFLKSMPWWEKMTLCW